MDNFIKKYLGQNGDLGAYSIEPSGEFVGQTMTRLRGFYRRKIWATRILMAIASLSPFSTRIAWDYIRGDYFSLSQMPFGSYLTSAYSLFMTASATYFLLFFGAGTALILILKNKYYGEVIPRA